MSSSCKQKPRGFGSDIHRLLLAAEAGQKADILAYSSGHLGPRSLNQSLPHNETKQPFWRMSQSQEETPNPLTLQQRQTKALAYVKKKEMKDSPSEFTTGTALVESEVLRSRQDQATDHSSHADRKEDTSTSPKIVHCSANSLPVNPRVLFQKKSHSSCDQGGKQQFHSCHTDQVGLNKEDQLKTKPQCGRQVIAMQDLWDCNRMGRVNVAERHEKKLQKELKKLSEQSWPSRDRLVVFSDVFDDVCEGSPVFGRILREIKTEYDLYVNHMMASQSSSPDMWLNTSLEDLGNDKVELEDAEKEVCRLEQEARRAQEENRRAQNELQNVPAVIHPEDKDVQNTSLSGLQDSSCTNSVQSKRLQVLNVWKEVQQLEVEINKMVSTVETTATERCIKDQKTKIMRLIASNDCLKITNKELENNIKMTLNRDKASKAIRRYM
ncbi:uncharacterized protein C6orf118-like [Scomber japonicus]|uniref:uncharacterized protein C6orf118-like n=1 Tax=Scomber japonicus TaxID=13676 RepID=UPI0023063DAC|nr:uncharacterized protein C6orf118-like [Scomber japonicus]